MGVLTAVEIFVITHFALIGLALIHPFTYAVPSIKENIESKIVHADKEISQLETLMMPFSALCFFSTLILFAVQLEQGITITESAQLSLIEISSVIIFFVVHTRYMAQKQAKEDRLRFEKKLGL